MSALLLLNHRNVIIFDNNEYYFNSCNRFEFELLRYNNALVFFFIKNINFIFFYLGMSYLFVFIIYKLL